MYRSEHMNQYHTLPLNSSLAEVDGTTGEHTWWMLDGIKDGRIVCYTPHRPETLEQLRVAREQIKEKDIQIENLRRNYNEVRDSVDREMTRVRDEYEDDIKEYRALVAYQREQLNRKDDYIDRLAKKAGI